MRRIVFNSRSVCTVLGFVFVFAFTCNREASAQNTFPGSGNAGAGTQSPTAPLTVQGSSSDPSLTSNTAIANIKSSSTVELTFGGQAASPYSFWMQTKRSPNDGYSYPLSLNPLGGNVGIGTTSPYGKLSIVSPSIEALGVGYQGTNSNRLLFGAEFNGTTGAEANVGFIGYGPVAGDGTARSIAFGSYNGSAWKEIMRLQSGGNVGIGTATPQVTLDTWTAARGTSYNPADLTTWADHLIKNPTNNSGAATGIAFQLYNSYHPNAGTGIAAVRSDPGNDYQADLAFITRPYQAVAQERMRILSNGNVGIGTTSPSYTLDVNGQARIGTIHTSVAVNPPSTGVTQGVSIGFDGNPEIGWIQSSRVNATAAELRGLSLQPLGGNVGIGTTTPNYKLDVNGTINATGLNVNGSTFTSSQWSTNGGNINFASGNVGIGIASPSTKLEVVGSVTASNIGRFKGWLAGGESGQAAEIGLSSGVAYVYNYNRSTNSHGDLQLGDAAGGVYVKAGGNVGIGTTSPNFKLQIGGNAAIGLQSGADALQMFFNGSNSSYTSLQQTSSEFRVEQTYSSTGGYLPISFHTAGAERLKIDTSGNTNVTGDLHVTGNIGAKYQDVAEWVPSSEELSPGTVVVLDSTKSNQVTSSTVSYDTRVAGVVSAQPGIALGEKSDNKVLVATTGRVRVKVDATKNPIHIGDLLVTSDIPGLAMKSEPIMIGGRQIHAPGTLIGKALEPLEKGKGTILVLLSLQ
jgi:hypothetical protein